MIHFNNYNTLLINRLLLSFIFITISVEVYSQNSNLTKGQTIEYLNKKIKEVAGLQSFISGQNYPDNLRSFGVSMQDNRIEIYHTYPNSYSSEIYKFNPRFIEKVEMPGFMSKDSVTSIINLALKDPIASYTGTSGQYVTRYVSFPFMYSDRSNFEKIKKALFHLKALMEAEEDPFK